MKEDGPRWGLLRPMHDLSWAGEQLPGAGAPPPESAGGSRQRIHGLHAKSRKTRDEERIEARLRYARALIARESGTAGVRRGFVAQNIGGEFGITARQARDDVGRLIARDPNVLMHGARLWLVGSATKGLHGWLRNRQSATAQEAWDAAFFEEPEEFRRAWLFIRRLPGMNDPRAPAALFGEAWR